MTEFTVDVKYRFRLPAISALYETVQKHVDVQKTKSNIFVLADVLMAVEDAVYLDQITLAATNAAPAIKAGHITEEDVEYLKKFAEGRREKIQEELRLAGEPASAKRK
tara:strand:- start:311 stop:634 length:324 start_codon:yes stop_codon:yes gene_type:complete